MFKPVIHLWWKTFSGDCFSVWLPERVNSRATEDKMWEKKISVRVLGPLLICCGCAQTRARECNSRVDKVDKYTGREWTEVFTKRFARHKVGDTLQTQHTWRGALARNADDISGREQEGGGRWGGDCRVGGDGGARLQAVTAADPV